MRWQRESTSFSFPGWAFRTVFRRYATSLFDCENAIDTRHRDLLDRTATRPVNLKGINAGRIAQTEVNPWII
jgi:hypothetical protein